MTEKERAEGKLPQGIKYRLPTDEEWSRAAGLAKEEGATPKERSRKNEVDFPWGSGFPPVMGKAGNYADTAYHERFPKEPWIEGYTDVHTTTSPVASFAPNAYGLYDMGGNVWEWCEDLYEAGSSNRVLRGAGWDSLGRENLLSSLRFRDPPAGRYRTNGFRCVLVRDEEPSPPRILK